MISLVTGANGFLGSHVTRLLVERGEGCAFCSARIVIRTLWQDCLCYAFLATCWSMLL
jgi:nucleoside-diphosphate-sugar epimerase